MPCRTLRTRRLIGAAGFAGHRTSDGLERLPNRANRDAAHAGASSSRPGIRGRHRCRPRIRSEIDQLPTRRVPRRPGTTPGRRVADQQRPEYSDGEPVGRPPRTLDHTASRAAAGTPPSHRKPPPADRSYSRHGGRCQRMSSSNASGAGSVHTHGVPSSARNIWSWRSIATSPPGARLVCARPPTPVGPHSTMNRTGGYRPSAHSRGTRSVPMYAGSSRPRSRSQAACPA